MFADLFLVFLQLVINKFSPRFPVHWKIMDLAPLDELFNINIDFY